MPDVFPVEKLYRTGVVVWDLKKAARSYTEVYGIEKWQVIHHIPSRLTNATYFGREVQHGWSSAIGKTANGVLTFELIQPGGGPSSYKQFLYSHGEGVHDILLHAGDRKDLADLRHWLAGQGIGVKQSGTVDGSLEYDIFDTHKPLGGFYLKAVATDGGNFEEAITPDEVWDFTGEISRPNRGPLVVPQMNHFGIVVRDVVERAESYSRLFGLPKWNFGLWHSAEGSLVESHFEGNPVEHAYFTTLTPIADFGFELVQPAYGPQDYKENYLNRVGEGIHHMFTATPAALGTMQEWESLREWMTSMGAPLIQGAKLGNGFMEFFYLNTREKLCGYVTEAGVMMGERPMGALGGVPPVQTERTLPPPPNGRNSRDFSVDFTRVAPQE